MDKKQIIENYIRKIVKEEIDSLLLERLRINSKIDFPKFANNKKTLKFSWKTPEYKALNTLEDRAWDQYVDYLAKNGMRIEYDDGNDVFIVNL